MTFPGLKIVEIRANALKIAARNGFTLSDILSRDRTEPLASVRLHAMREVYALGFPVGLIAKAFKRTHGAVSYAINGRSRKDA